MTADILAVTAAYRRACTDLREEVLGVVLDRRATILVSAEVPTERQLADVQEHVDTVHEQPLSGASP